LVASLAVIAAYGAPDRQSARPGWATRLQGHLPTAWDGWHNALAPQGEAVSLPLARDGVTDYVIVLPENPTGQQRRAGDELQLWLGEITGAKFPIVSDTEPVRPHELCIGETRRSLPDSAAKPPIEGYTIAADGERVFLLGGANPGPLAAVLALLEEDLGVRWYGPERERGNWAQNSSMLNAKRWPMGKVRVPKQKTLVARVVPRTRAPKFPIRHLMWQRSYSPWGVRNRVNGGFATGYGQHSYLHGGYFVHTFHHLVPPKTYFADHPDYFALINGKRKWENAQICLSNPEVATVAAETIAKSLRGIPESQRRSKHLVSVSAMDWEGDCQCDACQKARQELGGYSGLQLTFVNRVAEAVAPEFPWVTITTLAYRQSKQPPTVPIKAHPNVAVRFCTDFGASFNWPYHSLYDVQIPDLAEQRRWYEDWQKISPRMHLWIYPHQYRHPLAPTPNIRAVVDNLRFFCEHHAESVFVQQSAGLDYGRADMRYWLFAKLMWDPTRNVEDLIRDFVWGYYGASAPAVYEYEKLLWNQCLSYTDFSRKRNWIHAIHNEDMYRHGFADKAREILGRAAKTSQTDEERTRVARLLIGVPYVESVQLYMQMRDGDTPPDVARYKAIAEELETMCGRLGVDKVGFYDGALSVIGTDEWLLEMRKVYERRFDQRYLPNENWGEWTFRWDLQDQGMPGKWFAPDLPAGKEWQEVEVPAFLADTPAGNEIGYGWYRTTFTLPESHAGKPIELQFGGVDEQAWIYVNGEYVGEQTLKSEFMVGQEVTVADLWNRPFTRTVKAELLKPGKNVLAVRIHNSAMNAGIHQPVRIYLPDVPFQNGCDGKALTETFENVKKGEIPAGWKRSIQQRDGHVFGKAEVSRHFVQGPSLHLQDQRSHVAIWSAADDVLPEGRQWAVQFDFRLTGRRCYKAADVGGIFGLKQGEMMKGQFLPLAQVDNGESPGKPVTLLGLGKELAADLEPDKWHRLIIRRDGTDWQFYLDDELKGTVKDRDTGLRGIAFGSFVNWHHVAEDIHYANLKIGGFIPLAE
jgi:hypothetical protein